MSENCEIACYNIQQPKVVFPPHLFYLTISPKPKDIHFTIMHKKEKDQILMFGWLEPASVMSC